MSRKTDSPYVRGDYWLDFRRDGASPGIWQIASYIPGSRQVVYRSTRLRDVEAAKGKLDAHYEEQASKRLQPVEEATIAGAMAAYWNEKGKHAVAPAAIAGSFRAFLGFLMQDEATPQATIAQIGPAMVRRFTRWRMKPHSWSVPWAGKEHRHQSKGVKGETVASDLARVKAAINYQLDEGRITLAPRMPLPEKKLRSVPRETLLSVEQIGAILAVAAADRDSHTFRWLAHQAATCARPFRALQFDPRKQCDFTAGLVDLHPENTLRTRKRNPVVPMIEPMRPIYQAWAKDGPDVVGSRKRAWRTIRRVLKLPAEVEPKTIRYSVATELRRMGTVPAIQLESLLGHDAVKGVTARYAKYDPAYLAEAKAALTIVFERVAAAAVAHGAVQMLSNNGNGPRILVDGDGDLAQISAVLSGAAYRNRTCDPRITNARKGGKSAVSRPTNSERSEDE